MVCMVPTAVEIAYLNFDDIFTDTASSGSVVYIITRI